MAKVRLTEDLVNAAEYKGKPYKGGKWSQCILWDEKPRGFGLRVLKTGRKNYVLRYRNAARKQRLMNLGPCESLTLQEAREKAKAHLGIVAEGRDPQAEKWTMEQLAERYLRQYAEKEKKPSSIKKDRQMVRDYVIPKLGRLKVAAVTRAEISGLHHSLREKPYAANRVLSLMSKMFNLAEVWGLRPDGSNPCHNVERNKAFQRKPRVLSQDEINRLTDALYDEMERGEWQVVAAILLLFLEGWQIGEVLNLRWKDVDLKNEFIFLSGSRHHLTNWAKEALWYAFIPHLSKPWPLTHHIERGGENWSELPELSGFVIEGRLSGKPRADLKRPWKRIQKSAGLEAVRLRDLRNQ